MVSALYDPLNRYYQQLRTAQAPGVSTVPGGPAYGGFGDWVNQTVSNNLWQNAESSPTTSLGGADSASTQSTGGAESSSTGTTAPARAESSPVATAAFTPAAVTTASTAAQGAASTAGLPSWARQTAGRSGASYQSLISDPNFDPWTNGDSYWGAGGSQDPAIQQAFGYTNQMARGMGYSDGSRLPPDLKRQIFLANLERTRQQYADNGQNWDATAAAKLPSQGWAYTPGWGLTHGGQSYETQGGTQGGAPGATGGGVPATTTAPAGTAPVTTATTGTGGTGGTTGTTGTTGADGQFALGGQYWMQHPQEASDAFLRSHGINPDAHTAMGDWMLKQVQGLVPGLFGTYFGSGGQNPTDQLSDPNQLLNSIFYGGGGIGGNLQRYAGNAMNILRNNPTMQANLGDTGTQQFLQTLEGLNTYGMNPYMGQAYSNAFDAAMNRQRIAQRGQLFANQPVTSLWDFINQAGQPGFSSYGLPGQ